MQTLRVAAAVALGVVAVLAGGCQSSPTQTGPEGPRAEAVTATALEETGTERLDGEDIVVQLSSG